jgi:hypothetical protein
VPAAGMSGRLRRSRTVIDDPEFVERADAQHNLVQISVIGHGVGVRPIRDEPQVSLLGSAAHVADAAELVQVFLGLLLLFRRQSGARKRRDIAEGLRCYWHVKSALSDLQAAQDLLPGATCSDYERVVQSLGLALWVDAGVRDTSLIPTLADAGIPRIVVGLETVAGPGELGKILERLDAARVVFSLDLKEGRPLGDVSRWKGPDSWSIAEQAGLHPT